jgi:hypothetical protein
MGFMIILACLPDLVGIGSNEVVVGTARNATVQGALLPYVITLNF